MNHTVVDFRKPGRVPEDIGQMLTQWQRESREAIELRFGRVLPPSLRVEVPSPEPIMGDDLRTCADTAIVYRVDVLDYATPTLILLDRKLAIAMATEMLGSTEQDEDDEEKEKDEEKDEEVKEETVDRALSDIEMTCLDFLIEELRASIEISQKLTPPRSMKVVGKTQLKELYSEFPANVTNSSVAFRFHLPSGEGLIRWVLPQAVTLDMAASLPKTIQSNSMSRKALERLVLSAPCELSVRLGQTHLPLSKLGTLAPGDIIVLDQKIDEPLRASVGGQSIFFGWPARHAKQQVFQIDEHIDVETQA